MKQMAYMSATTYREQDFWTHASPLSFNLFDQSINQEDISDCALVGDPSKHMLLVRELIEKNSDVFRECLKFIVMKYLKMPRAYRM